MVRKVSWEIREAVFNNTDAALMLSKVLNVSLEIKPEISLNGKSSQTEATFSLMSTQPILELSGKLSALKMAQSS